MAVLRPYKTDDGRRNLAFGLFYATDITALGSGTEPVAVGAARGNYFVDGTLDDALCYTRGLTPAEIVQLAAP